jgi:hypothetical protein
MLRWSGQATALLSKVEGVLLRAVDVEIEVLFMIRA